LIIERAEHPDWLSNAYLVADRVGGHGVLIDGNGVVESLLTRVKTDGIEITHVLLTHHHVDHVVAIRDYKERFAVPVLAHPLTAAALEPGIVDETIDDGDFIASGALTFNALHTPGHAADHLAFLSGEECFTADVLFKGSVGGTRGPGGNYLELRSSIMERLMTLPRETRIHPGHCESSRIGIEQDENPFVRVWRGIDPEGTEPCVISGEHEGTLLLWADDYDGGHKALVRFASGEEAIVGGSQVERLDQQKPSVRVDNDRAAATRTA